MSFFDNFYTFITYNNVFLGLYFIHTHTHKNYHYNFLPLNLPLNFGIVPATQAFFLCFHRFKKPTIFTLAVMTKPLLCSKRPWVVISTVYNSYRWLFSFAQCWNVSECWSQTILSQTHSYRKKCWNYYQPCCRCCFYIW